MLTAQEFMALHRHWMWANIIKQHFETEVRATKGQLLAQPEMMLADKFGA
jgi:hypothetical protein